jgi:formate/nitrite transporter FocA (FNT family)
MVWLLPGAETRRVSIIIIIIRTYLIGLGGYNHVIAGSNKFCFLIVEGAETWGRYLATFFVPILLGNVIGGVSLVAFLGHAQVVSGKKPSRKPRITDGQHICFFHKLQRIQHPDVAGGG